jgi:hypothetical protein
MPLGIRLAAACSFAGLLLWGPAAAGDESSGSQDVKAQCIRTAEAAQTERLDGPLLDARRDALSCARDVCPAPVRADCRGWLDALEASIPSVVVRADDGEGRPRADVRVTVDGVVVAAVLDGRPIDINPGMHRFQFEAPGATAVEQTLLVTVGEKNRPIAVKLARPVEVEAQAERPRVPLALRLSLFGVGLAGVTTFAALGIPAHFDAESDRTSCAPNCPQSEVDSLRTRLIVGDVGLAVGILGAAAGTWLTFWPPGHAVASAAIAPIPGGLAGAFTETF